MRNSLKIGSYGKANLAMGSHLGHIGTDLLNAGLCLLKDITCPRVDVKSVSTRLC